jgi:hypothetical protein
VQDREERGGQNLGEDGAMLPFLFWPVSIGRGRSPRPGITICRVWYFILKSVCYTDVVHPSDGLPQWGQFGRATDTWIRQGFHIFQSPKMHGDWQCPKTIKDGRELACLIYNNNLHSQPPT